jgi:hypothetical protein
MGYVDYSGALGVERREGLFCVKKCKEYENKWVIAQYFASADYK